MDGIHAHLRILFADGSAWIARLLRHNFTSFADKLSNDILLSECATPKWLETVDVPSSLLHGYGLRNDPYNDVGVAFMLNDELPGQWLQLPSLSQCHEQSGKGPAEGSWRLNTTEIFHALGWSSPKARCFN